MMITLSSKAKEKDSKRVKRGKPHAAESPGRMEELLQAYFKNREEVILAYLFGSFVNWKNGQFHDIDIGVFLDPEGEEVLDREMPYGYHSFLTAEVIHLLKFDRVDVVILNNAPPLLLRRVIGTGKLLFYRSESDRIRFEIVSLKRYSDTAQIRKIKRLYMERRMEKGLSAYG